MKKIFCLLIIVFLFCACGKQPAEMPAAPAAETISVIPSETTLPPETTLPLETDPVPEETEPPAPAYPEPVFVEYPIVEPNTAITQALLQQYVDALCGKYPSLLTQDTYGTSVMGRPLVYLTMGHGKTEICAVAGMHAWEHINCLYLLRCIEDMAESWSSEDGMFGEYNLHKLLEEYTIYFVPDCNPDGSEACITGAEMLFTKYPIRGILKSNAAGVDLNRNFPYIWDEANTGVYYPGERYYKGPEAGSEPETQALMELCLSHDFQFMFSFHIQGKVIYWIDSTTGEIPDSRILANNIGKRCRLEPAGVSTNKGVYGGGFENWFRLACNRPGFCIELIRFDWNVEIMSETFWDADRYLEYDNSKYILPEAMRTLGKLNRINGKT